MLRSPGSTERPDLPLAVVIGAGAMGAAIARRLGQDHRLLIADRDEGRVMGFAAALRTEGQDATGIVCDITNADSVTALADAAPGWRTLAHVAALSPSMGDWQTIMAVNLLGALHVEGAFLKTASPGSAAIFISSLAAHGNPPAPPVLAQLDEGLRPQLLARLADLLPDATSAEAYMLSKFATNRMCARQAAAWGERQARIMSLSPGLIATPMGATEFEKSPIKWSLYQMSPLQREGTMIEIAAALAFLASPAASFISGIDLLVDGGLGAARRFAAPPTSS